MRILLICNPNSTSQNEGLFRQIIPVLRDVEGVEMLVKNTHYPRHAEEIVSGLTRDDFDAIVAVGGDGTVAEIINGMLGPVELDEDGKVAPGDRPQPEQLPALAIIPTGSANVFVRALGFPASPVEATHVLARLLERNQRRKICLGTWNERWFAVNAGFGLDADVLARVDRAREKGFSATPLRYLSVAVRGYLRARRTPPQITVEARAMDGKELKMKDAPLIFASNTNPWTFLGPLPVVTNPENSFSQGLGLFGLTDLGGVTGLVGMLHLAGADKRRLLNKLTTANTVEFDDAETVTLTTREPQRFQADGESEGKFDHVRLSSVVDAIEVFAPRDPEPPHERSAKQILRDLIRIN